MKNNLLKLITFLVFTLAFMNCSKDCETKIATCSETPPTDELCLAYFSRWFYNEDQNKCEEIPYSGCTQKGFATKVDCEQCECND